jgi:glycerol-3-phosphate acyltransferase PlsY
MAIVYLGIAVLAYLIGALPIGGMVAGLKRIDIRQHGSGKLGTTNVLRTIGRRAAVLVLVGDFLKGSLAVWVGRLLAQSFAPNARVSWFDDSFSVLTIASVVAALAAIAGHVWSIYMRLWTGKWSGGRGVATALGAMLVFNPWITLVAVAVGVPTIIISRYVSLGSILGAVAGGLGIILAVVLGYMPVLSLLFVSIAAFVIIAHRDNIERLLNGSERKIGDRAKV